MNELAINKQRSKLKIDASKYPTFHIAIRWEIRGYDKGTKFTNNPNSIFMKFYIQILLILLTQSIIAQSKPGSPGYSPLPAKIVSVDFKSSTKPKKKGKLSFSEFLETKPSEFLHIYSNYEMDSAGVFDSKGHFVSVDSKFMDLYLVYEYKYRVSLEDIENINNLLPKIFSMKGDQLLKINIVSYSSKKGKVKSRKIKKKFLKYSIKDGYLLLDIDKSQLIDPYIEINVLIKSRNFIQLTPLLTDGKFFSRYLECSLPAFLLYSFPGTNEGYELVSTSESHYKVLELNRSSDDWDMVTREYNVTVENKSWTITQKSDNIKPIELTGIDPSFTIDMGFNMVDILK